MIDFFTLLHCYFSGYTSNKFQKKLFYNHLFFLFLVAQELPLPAACSSSKDVQLFGTPQKAIQANAHIHNSQMLSQPSNLTRHLQNVNTAYL